MRDAKYDPPAALSAGRRGGYTKRAMIKNSLVVRRTIGGLKFPWILRARNVRFECLGRHEMTSNQFYWLKSHTVLKVKTQSFGISTQYFAENQRNTVSKS